MTAQDVLLKELVGKRRAGFSLPGAFYTSPDVFSAEVERFITSQWIMAGHISQIPARGDFFRFEAAGYSLIVVRDANDQVRAMQNVCRHRGAQVCEPMKGNARRLYCRYHAWTYGLDGSLVSFRHMPDGVEKADFGLTLCGVAVFEGMIFVSIDPGRAPDFDLIAEHVRRHWERFDLADCEIAAEEVYVLNANWKLAVENNLECYHCLPSHPEFSSVNAFVRHDEKVSAEAVAEFTQYSSDWRRKMAEAGVIADRTGFLAVGGQLCRAGASPLGPGFTTGSRDGAPVAPLLGRVTHPDESVTTGCFGFHSYMVAMSDYAATFTFIPQGPDLTHVVAKWFVRRGAASGRDYDPAELRWLWDETTRQDKDIVELNARGVGSRGYEPGPYSELEWMVDDFVVRYLALMS